MDLFGVRARTSVEMHEIMPPHVIAQADWRKRFGHGWFSYLAPVAVAPNSEVYIADFENVLPSASYLSLAVVRFTLMIVHMEPLGRAAADSSRIAANARRLWPKLLNGNHATIRTQIVDNYLFIWCDHLMDRQSMANLRDSILAGGISAFCQDEALI